jgi:hypothetical protein
VQRVAGRGHGDQQFAAHFLERLALVEPLAFVKQLFSWCSALELERHLGEQDISVASSPAEW